MLNVLTLEVKDEILEGEPLYIIKDSNGNIIYDNVQLELKTPLLQEGTAINKQLFDKINEGFTNIKGQKKGNSIAMFNQSKILIF